MIGRLCLPERRCLWQEEPGLTAMEAAAFVPAMIPHVACLLAGLSTPAASPAPAKLAYPEVRRTDFSETIHGVTVPDPYRWLEDIDSPETKKFVEAQAAMARKYLDGLPTRGSFKSRLEEVWNYDRHGVPRLAGDRLFYSRRTGLQNQSVFHWRENRPGSAEKTLLDVNTLSADGTVAVGGESVSDDGRYWAYSVSKAGSDWQEWQVMDVTTGKPLPDVIKWVKFSHASWTRDSTGFYYGRYDEPKPGQELKEVNINQKLFHHRLGSPQAGDRLIYSRPDQPQWQFGGSETDDGRFLMIEVTKGAATKNALFYRDLKAGADSPVVELLKDFDARYDFVGNDDSVLYLFTDKDAPRGRLIAIDTRNPAPSAWKTVIPESTATLQSVSYLGGKFIAQRLVDAHDEVRLFDRDGRETGTVSVPALSSVSGFGGRQNDRETYYYVTGYTLPGEIFHYDVTTGRSESIWTPKLKFDPALFATEQVFYPSRDGTRIPLSLIHKKGLKRDGTAPTILYGYGGFNIPLTPAFSPSLIPWLEKGGVYAVANLRGGGEYGEEWHEAGKRLKKQNVFDDFIAAAEFLVKEKWSGPGKVGIAGGSNGGLLVGACVLQRPDLFGGAVADVGVHDLIRFPKFTIGWAWQDEYGFPEKDADEFKNLLKLSPYHNVKPGLKLPPTMIATADHDDRVFPAHSFKFGAALQAAQTGDAPIVLRIETKAGHGAGTPTSKTIDTAADRFAFFAHSLGLGN